MFRDVQLNTFSMRRATKYILNDFTSSYKSRLTKLYLLSLMCVYELHDLIFYIKSYKYPSSYFNINEFIFLVLYQQDQVQVSNFNIILLVLPQILLIIFISVDFLNYETHFQL